METDRLKFPIKDREDFLSIANIESEANNLIEEILDYESELLEGKGFGKSTFEEIARHTIENWLELNSLLQKNENEELKQAYQADLKRINKIIANIYQRVFKLIDKRKEKKNEN